MGKSLAELIKQVPPTNPQNVENSCDEESSDEEQGTSWSPPHLPGKRPIQPKSRTSTTHKSITAITPRAGPSTARGVGGNSASGGGSGTTPQVTKRVEATVGRGGKLVYQTVTTRLPSWYYTVQWRKPQTKKHKTWDGDAFLRVEGNKVVMISETGDTMASSALIGGLPESGNELRIGPYDCEVDNEITADEFKRSTCILNKAPAKALHMGYAPSTYARPFKAPTQTHAARPVGGYIPATGGYTKLPKQASSDEIEEEVAVVRAGPSSSFRPPLAERKEIPPDRFYAAKPKGDRIVIGEKSKKRRMEWDGALHDPKAEGAVVMQRPEPAEAKRRDCQIVDVVLDPFLSSKMRDHQKEGVKFMYSCVMGMTEAQANGCILADEMGLGKTLQTIALIYTLLKQTPFDNESSVIGKALVVCPVSLVDNWKKEFRKWVRPDQLNVVAADTSDSVVKAFTHHRGQHVLVIGYERLRKVIKILSSCQPPIDLIVCDEGHRLKSKDNKTTRMFEQLRTRRRIILSGTPVQNDLGEYFSMVDFTCPGLLGTYPQFVKHYEKPIMKSRMPGVSGQKLEDGRARADELGNLSKHFVLRRTAQVLKNYLPPKNEYVVFVAPSEHQQRAVARILDPKTTEQILRGDSDKQPLAYIDLLRKVANTPTILRLKKGEDSSRSEDLVRVSASAVKALPDSLGTYDVAASGKLLVLDRMLDAIWTTTDEKVVIVSNFVVTLNVIQEICKKKRYAFLRLDGQIPQKQRQEIVDEFNKTTRTQSFVFLLSAKAGGVGLNLIGASRLFLFDSDWNPSTDMQAMARIHRDGQKKPVFIYRLLTTNSIDEKIYQRQLTKVGLADQMMDQGQNSERTKDSFSLEDLRDIFRVNNYTDGCQTHDLSKCDCRGKQVDREGQLRELKEAAGLDDEDDAPSGFMSASQYDPKGTSKMQRKAEAAKAEQLAALRAWEHMDAFRKESFVRVTDTLLYNLIWADWGEHGSAETSENPSAAVSEIADDDVATEAFGDAAGSAVADSQEEEDQDKEMDSDMEEDVSGPKRKEAPNRLDLLELSDEEFDGPFQKALQKHKKGKLVEDGGDEDNASADGASESEEEAEVGKKRKSLSSQKKIPESASESTSPAKPRSKSKPQSRSPSAGPAKKQKIDTKGKGKASARVNDVDKGRTHDLRVLTGNGQGGRIMYLFEKKMEGQELKKKGKAE